MDLQDLYFFEGINSEMDTALLSLFGDVRNQQCSPIKIVRINDSEDKFRLTVQHESGCHCDYDIHIVPFGHEFYAYTLPEEDFIDSIPYE